MQTSTITSVTIIFIFVGTLVMSSWSSSQRNRPPGEEPSQNKEDFPELNKSTEDLRITEDMREPNESPDEHRRAVKQRKQSLSDPAGSTRHDSSHRDHSDQDFAQGRRPKLSSNHTHDQVHRHGRRTEEPQPDDQQVESRHSGRHRSNRETNPSNSTGNGNTQQAPLSSYDQNQILVYVHTLQQENVRLVKDAEDFKYKVESLTRERDKLQGDLEKLQNEHLSTIDRYQPEFDMTFKLNFGLIRKPVSKLSRFIASYMTSEMPNEELLSKLMKYSWIGGSDNNLALINLENKGHRRRLWTSVIWRFLENELFCRPFLCFGGQWAETLDSLYSVLFPNANRIDESARWRASTVERLHIARSKEDDNLIKDRLQQDLLSLILELQYDVNVTKKGETVQGIVKDLAEKLIPFAQSLAGQRAVFRLLTPALGILKNKKTTDDLYLTNKDDDFNELDDELEGEVAYVVKPGLIKFGNGLGQKLDHEPTVIVPAFVELIAA